MNEKNIFLKQLDKLEVGGGITNGSEHERKRKNPDRNQTLEIGYLFQTSYWHKGYATEAAIACKEYAFSVLNASSVYSIIRDTNIASQNVAVRNGMKIIVKILRILGI